MEVSGGGVCCSAGLAVTSSHHLGCGAVVERVGWFPVPWPQQLLEVDISVRNWY